MDSCPDPLALTRWPSSALIRWNDETKEGGSQEWDALPFPSRGRNVFARLRTVVIRSSLFGRDGRGNPAARFLMTAANGPWGPFGSMAPDPNVAALSLECDQDVFKAVSVWDRHHKGDVITILVKQDGWGNGGLDAGALGVLAQAAVEVGVTHFGAVCRMWRSACPVTLSPSMNLFGLENGRALRANFSVVDVATGATLFQAPNDAVRLYLAKRGDVVVWQTPDSFIHWRNFVTGEECQSQKKLDGVGPVQQCMPSNAMGCAVFGATFKHVIVDQGGVRYTKLNASNPCNNHLLACIDDVGVFTSGSNDNKHEVYVVRAVGEPRTYIIPLAESVCAAFPLGGPRVKLCTPTAVIDLDLETNAMDTRFLPILLSSPSSSSESESEDDPSMKVMCWSADSQRYAVLDQPGRRLFVVDATTDDTMIHMPLPERSRVESMSFSLDATKLFAVLNPGGRLLTVRLNA